VARNETILSPQLFNFSVVRFKCNGPVQEFHTYWLHYHHHHYYYYYYYYYWMRSLKLTLADFVRCGNPTSHRYVPFIDTMDCSAVVSWACEIIQLVSVVVHVVRAVQSNVFSWERNNNLLADNINANTGKTNAQILSNRARKTVTKNHGNVKMSRNQDSPQSSNQTVNIYKVRSSVRKC